VSEERYKQIEQILRKAFTPSKLLIRDQSHLHSGHAGARDGKGHFAVTIVAEAFADSSRLERHRLIFDALSEMMQSDIHALTITAQTPDEANSL
jgi:BolA family transcriptional regulator, general stress-responsive regulator